MTTTFAPAPLDPGLEDGASASTPAGDNLLADFLTADACSYRALAEHGGGRAIFDEELGLSMGDSGSPCPFGNVAHVTRPLGPDAVTEVLARLARFYRESPGGAYLFFTPWSLGDLRPSGLHLAGHPPLMVRPPGGPVPPPPPVAVEMVRTPAQVAEFDRTLAQAYPAAELLPYGSAAPLFTPGAVEAGWTLLLARQGGRPVATAAAYPTGQVVTVGAIATEPDVRGRGIGAALTAAAVATAPDLPAVLLASDAGRPTYERLGFLSLLRFTLWVAPR